ncbi:hypothetical protein JW859_09285 [bacterium]|nr:hypothetical protein [bacterium]
MPPVMRRILTWAGRILGGIAGLGSAALVTGCPGVVAPTICPHPTVKLNRAAIVSPAKTTAAVPVAVQAVTNQPVDTATMQVNLYDANHELLRRFPLNDDGLDGDAVAGDGIWNGQYGWAAGSQGVYQFEVVLTFDFEDNILYEPQRLDLPDVVITPEAAAGDTQDE